jgi:transposase-like protein
MLTDTKSIVQRKAKTSWNRWYTDREKLEAVKCYLITGNQAATAAALNIHKNTMNTWVNSQWFKDLMEQVKREGNIQLTNKLRKIADKALDITQDRLENGEWIYDQKTGEMRRKAILAKDAHKIAVELLDRSFEVEDRQSREQTNVDTANHLELLANAFKDMANKTNRVEVIEHVIPAEQAGQN